MARPTITLIKGRKMEENVSSGVADQGAEQATNSIPGAAPGETKAETMARMFRVTVDGQEREVDEKELLRGYAHAQAANKRMEDASMTRKEAEQVLRIFKENPREAFKMLGTDARKFAEQVINDELNEALLSPEQRELRDYKSKVDKYESESRNAKEEFERETMEKEFASYQENIQNEIIDVLQTAKLPQSPRTISRIAYYMEAALNAGYNVTPKDVVDQVRDDYKAEMESLLGGLSDDELENYLGANHYRRIAKSSVKGGMQLGKVDKAVNINKAPREVDGKKPTSPREYFKRR